LCFLCFFVGFGGVVDSRGVFWWGGGGGQNNLSEKLKQKLCNND